ncbi:MAG: YfiR family protein [Verrucomicrobia bacterium]|nr:YfiR family protein [Verrucomicrobiota bacterium]
MNVTKDRGLRDPTRSAAAVIAVVLLWLCATIPVLASEGESAAREYEVKAAFLYNFATFVDWPEDAVPDAGDTFIIGVLGKDPFGPELDSIAASRTVRGKRIVVRRFATLDGYTPCHILFVAASEREHLPVVLKRLAGAAVLIVGDTGGFAEAGGMVNLVLEERKVRFEINQAAAERAGLRISSKLLRLARLVQGEAGGRGMILALTKLASARGPSSRWRQALWAGS